MSFSQNAPNGAATASAANNQAMPAENALILNGKLITLVRSELTSRLAPGALVKPCSKRDMIDQIVNQVGPKMGNCPLYSTIPRTESYKYFGSDTSRKIQEISAEKVIDKGKFVDACLLIYLYGTGAIDRGYVVPARELRPRIMSDDKLDEVVQKAAEIAASKDEVSEFVPTTSKVEL